MPVPLPNRTPTNATLQMELHDLQHVSVLLPALLPREARTSLTGFTGVSRLVENGAERIVVPLQKLEAFSRVAMTEAKVQVTSDLPDWLVRNMRLFREADVRREQAGDVVTRSLDEVLPKIVCEKLMDFQWHGVHFALKRGGRCLIADDMGLGKTLQAIAVARVYMHDWPLLIICPSSLRLNWKHELLQWLGDDIHADDIQVIMSGKDITESLLQITIVSYDLVRKIPSDFLKRYQFIIADESHYLKTTSALRSKAVIPLLKGCRRAILLSGTPALSRPVELYPQLNGIAPNLFSHYTDFVNRYCGAFQGRFGLDVSGSRNLPELHTLLCNSVLIRRKKDEVLTQLPSKQRHVMWVETKASVVKRLQSKRRMFDALKESIEAQGDDEARAATMKLKGLQNEMYALSADAKIDSVLEICKVTAESGVKFIVFAHHGSIVEKLDAYISGQLKLGIIRIDGKTPQKERQGLCRKFQEVESCRVAILSITAAGVGLTLTKATVVIFAELYWNPGSLLQAEDRAHRIGQRDSVLVKYLLAKETLDESMWATIRKKLTVVGQSLTGKAGKMEVKEDKKDDDDNAENASDIRDFFKKRSAKRQREKGTEDPPKNENDRILSQAHDDEVVLVNDNSVQLVSSGDVRPRESSVVDVDTEAQPSVAIDGCPAPKSKKPRNVTNDDEVEVISLDNMFPESLNEGNANLPQDMQHQALIDDDVALARTLQAQYEKEFWQAQAQGHGR